MAQTSGLFTGRAGTARFLLLYGLAVATTLLVWWLAPALALAIFLALSAWHFADDWRGKLKTRQRLPAGACVILLPVLFHQEEVGELFGIIVAPSQAGALIVDGLVLPASIAGIALTITIALAWRKQPNTAMEIALLPLLSLTLPPLVFFTVYFCGLHSPRHLIRVITASNVPMWQVLSVCAVVTLVTLALGLAVFLLLVDSKPLDSLVKVVFIGLSALTVPHMFLLEGVRRFSSISARSSLVRRV